MKTAYEAEWDLSGMRDRTRAQRLLRAISPETIIDQVASEAVDPQLTRSACWEWQPGKLMVGCSRAIVVIPLTRDTFDDLFHGRCGYRAQYYRSVVEGQHFNRLLVAALCDAAKRIVERYPKPTGWPIVERSLMGPHSKVWVYNDSEFASAPGGVCPATLGAPNQLCFLAGSAASASGHRSKGNVAHRHKSKLSARLPEGRQG